MRRKHRRLSIFVAVLLTFTMTFSNLGIFAYGIEGGSAAPQEDPAIVESQGGSQEDPAAGGSQTGQDQSGTDQSGGEQQTPAGGSDVTDPSQGGTQGTDSVEPSQDESAEPATDQEPAAEPAKDKTDTDKSDKTDADKDESKDKDQEAKGGADFVKKGKVKAVQVQGEAAESKSAARAELKEDTDLSDKDVNKAVATLFEDSDQEPESVDNFPREADGSYIENIEAKWITQDSVDNTPSGAAPGSDEALAADSLLYIKPSGNESQGVILQISYALSGEHDYAPGDITITIPAHMFKDRDGKPIGEISIPYPEEPSTGKIFNWKRVGDNIILTNTRPTKAATKGFIEFAIEGMSPKDMVDMQVSDPFDAYIQVVTHKGNTIALRSNELTAQFDTEAKVTNVTKRAYEKVERVPASAIPVSQRIEGETEYIRVNWYVFGDIKSNTRYQLDNLDTLPADAVVDPNGEEGHRTEADFKGFIINATDENGRELDKPEVYVGTKNGETSYYRYSTAYPASQFKKDTKYTFHNSMTFTVTETDPAAEVGNPNVNGGEDPPLVTTRTTTAQTVWSFTDPKWNNPQGHFMVVKNGNDDTKKNNTTHKPSYGSERSRSDSHLWSSDGSGWYGIYPAGLNQLQDAYAEQGEDGSIRLSYTIDSVGYVMPWMFAAPDDWYVNVVIDPKTGRYELVAESQEGSESVPCTRLSRYYTRPVEMTTMDTGISIGRNGEKLELGKDYNYVSVEICADPWVYKAQPQNIEPDGSWSAQDAGDGTFKYVRDESLSHYPDIELEIQRGGEWIHWATASWKSGRMVVTLHDGTTQTKGAVAVPKDTENFRTKVTLQNTSTSADNYALQAAFDYDVRPVIELKSTDELIGTIEAAFEESNTPAMQFWNSTNMVAVRPDEPAGSAEHDIVSIDNDGYDSVRGYTADTAVYPSKSSSYSRADVDYERNLVTIHYSAKVEERSVIHDKKTYEEAIAGGPMAERHGIWYDLLPKDVTPDLSTVKLRPGDNITDVRTVPNYKESGRTLLIVEADLTPVPERYYTGDMYYYEDVLRITFDATYPCDSIVDTGDVLHNVIAFESGNDQLGSVRNYSGEPDDPTAGNHVASERAFKTEDEIEAMTDLDKDRDTPSFVYAGVDTKLNILAEGQTGLSKDVEVNNDGWWSQGTYYGQKEANERNVYEGGQYSYRLRMWSAEGTISKDLILYDSLENFHAQTGKNDDIDVDAPRWQGTLLSVDTSQLEENGCKPVVYYSEVEDLQLSDETDPDKANTTNTNLSNGNVWIERSVYEASHKDANGNVDLSGVKAVAIDATKKTDGSDFELQPLESAVVVLNMMAPSGDAARTYISQKGAWGDSAMAYNNSHLLCTSIDAETMVENSDNFVRHDYTKVGLKEYKLKVTKKWQDDDDRDGIRPDSATFHLYRDGVDTGETLTLPAPKIDPETGEPTDEKVWEGYFEHIPLTAPDGHAYHYTVKEDDPEGYKSNFTLGTETFNFTNTHEPERISVSGTKTWSGDTEETRPSRIIVQLFANGEFVKQQTVTPDEHGNWNYTFEDVYRRENGEDIVYTVKETKVGLDTALDSYVPETSEDGHSLDNVYHPFGDLKVTKKVEDATDVSKEQLFAFTITLTEMQGGEEAPLPEDAVFEYEILDEEGHIVAPAEGENLTMQSGDTISIKGGQTIHIKELPEGVKYKVEEAEAEGFTLKTSRGDTGTIAPNKDTTATFVNQYEANGRINLGARKVLANRKLNRFQFRYQLYELVEKEDGTVEEKPIRSAANESPDKVVEEDGAVASSEAPVTFGALQFTQEDHGKTFRYKIVETDLGSAGYTFDHTVYYAEVTVTDNGDGTMTITPTYYKDSIEEGNEVEAAAFHNGYKAEGEIVLRAWKDLKGRRPGNSEFTFELLDENGKVLQTKTNTADGGIVFGAIHYDESDIGKVYHYGVREVPGSDPGVNYDDTVYGYTVEVLDNGDGTLMPTTGFATPIMETVEDAPCDLCDGTGHISSEGAEATFRTWPGWGVMFESLQWTYEDLITSGKNTYRYMAEDDPEAYAQLESLLDAYGRLCEIGKITFAQRSETPSDAMKYLGLPFDGNETHRISKITYTGNDAELARICGIPRDKRATYTLTVDVDYREVGSGDLWVYYYDIQISATIPSYDGPCPDCDGEGIRTAEVIVGWETEEGELPLFENTLKPGSLSVTKHVTDAESADPDQTFHFKVQLIGDDIPEGEVEYTVSSAAAGSGSQKATATVTDGEFEFDLHGEEKATFGDLPAGTTYQVFEDTADGWLLVEQSNVAGTIPANDTIDASFTNSYQPALTTAQFAGTKLLDGKAAEADSYSFVLRETTEGASGTATMLIDGEQQEVELPYMVKVGEGGFIQFPVIVYDQEDVGEHTYEIAEVNPNDYRIDYDTHKETVTVTVAEDTDTGKLTSRVTTDEDGIRFVNKTRPGELRIRKNGNNASEESQKDLFTFKITLNGPNGLPLDENDQIYWYTLDKNGQVVVNAPAPSNKGNTTKDTMKMIVPGAALPEDTPAVVTTAPTNGEAASNTAAPAAETAVPANAAAMPSGEALPVKAVDPAASPASVADNTFKAPDSDTADPALDASWMPEETPGSSNTKSEKGTKAAAPAAQPASGTYRDIDWRITADGELILGKEGMTQTMTGTGTAWPWRNQDVTSVRVEGTVVAVGSLERMFYNMRSVTDIDLTGLDTSAVTNMSFMFGQCRNLAHLDVSGFDTGNVTTMKGMFCLGLYNPDVPNPDNGNYSGWFYNSALTELDLSNFDTGKVTDMSYMFQGTHGLGKPVIEGFDTSKVTNMEYMFYSSGITEMDLSGWNVSSLTTVKEFCHHNVSLKSVDLSGWNAANLTTASFMFNWCPNLETVTMTGINTPKLRSTDFMFSMCYKLEDLDVADLDTQTVTTANNMFEYCRSLKALDVSNFDTGSMTNMSSMFNGCTGLQSLDVSGFDTSHCTNMSSMFSDCSSLDALDVSGFETSKVQYMASVFSGCRSLTYLDLSNWDSSHAGTMKTMFSGTSRLSKIELGPKFTFRGSASSTSSVTTNMAYLMEPPKTAPYTGKWIREDGTQGPLAYIDFRNASRYDPTTMYGTWVWERNDLRAAVYFDANGGNTTATTVFSETVPVSVTLPTAATTKRPHYALVGWNTRPNGTGTSYDPGATTDALLTKPGEVVTVYAQWEESDLRDYKVRHYQQRTTLSGYTAVLTETLQAPKGTEVTPDTMEYEGFIAPEKQTVTVKDDDSTIVSYYYDRVTYEIAFDGNGATSGQMDNISMVYGVSKRLTANVFAKEGAIFQGWNTEPDGSGDSYADRYNVSNLTTEDGKTVTLYAQWLMNPNEELEPAQGVIYVQCKAGETIVLPGLPEGTTYTVEEVDMPNGWTQTSMSNDSGTIRGNVISNVTANNRYQAEGEAIIEAHKSLDGGELTEGQFTFDLYQYGMLVQTVTNGPVDTAKTVTDENGNTVDNPWYGTAPIVFDAINYSWPGTYRYTIKERAGDASYTYDEREIEVTVTVRDVGGGKLETEVTYGDGGALFENSMGTGKLKVSKHVEGTESDESFTFTVTFKDKDGNPLEGTYEARMVDDDAREVKVIARTDNLDDAGNRVTDYGNAVNYYKLVEIPGAESLHVKLQYTPARSPYGSNVPGFCIWKGLHPEIQGDSPAFTEEFNPFTADKQYLNGSSDEFDIEGDSLTFYYQSYAVPEYDEYWNPWTNYGYYAVVTGEVGLGEPFEISSGDTFTLRDGENIQFSGLPDGATYTVTEQTKTGWTQTDATNTTGEIAAGETAEASFTNSPDHRPYNATGSAQFEVTKVTEGDVIPATDTFTFVLEDDDENVIQTKGTDKAGVYESTVTFDAIDYTLSDLGADREETFTYYVNEDPGEDPIADATYDRHTYVIKVHVKDGGNGKLITDVKYYDPSEGELVEVEKPTFTNILPEPEKTSLAVRKVWFDNSNEQGKRPSVDEFKSKLKVYKLDADGTETLVDPEAYTLTVTADADQPDVWEIQITDLRKMDGKDEIQYIVKEDAIDGYFAFYQEDADGNVKEYALDGEIIANGTEGFPDGMIISIDKKWDGDEELLDKRPSAEDFKDAVVLLQNGEATDFEAMVMDNEDGTYTVVFGGIPDKDENGEDYIYTVKEANVPAGYKVKGSDTAGPGETITNEPDTSEEPGKLELTKTLDAYVDMGEDSNVTLSFKIEIKKGGKTTVRHVGMTFGPGDDLSQTVTVEDIPLGAEITVTEEYSGNYTPSDPATATYNAETGIYTVKMDNSHGDNPHSGSGIVNKYKDGKYVEPTSGGKPQE